MELLGKKHAPYIASKKNKQQYSACDTTAATVGVDVPNMANTSIMACLVVMVGDGCTSSLPARTPALLWYGCGVGARGASLKIPMALLGAAGAGLGLNIETGAWYVGCSWVGPEGRLKSPFCGAGTARGCDIGAVSASMGMGAALGWWATGAATTLGCEIVSADIN